MPNAPIFQRIFQGRKKEPQSELCMGKPFRAQFECPTGQVPETCYSSDPGENSWYPPIMIGASSIASQIMQPDRIQAALELLLKLDPDDYVRYLIRFYQQGLKRFGSSWRYADIVTVLMTLSELLKPRTYLEIGVRRGRSVCAVASRAPECHIVMFDWWAENFAGMESPEPDCVRAELRKIGHRGEMVFVNGDSHEALPRYFSENPDACFDLIAVDGDHSDEGAAQDLRDVLPKLNIGGAVVFDDLGHPLHPGLKRVWLEMVADEPRFTAWSFEEVGFGVGFGMRRW
jgi:predicted O-methyltransferase YrrM